VGQEGLEVVLDDGVEGRGPAPTMARLRTVATSLVPQDRPGDFNQALMELTDGNATNGIHTGRDDARFVARNELAQLALSRADARIARDCFEAAPKRRRCAAAQ
jgi:hypothetical protein